MPEVSSCRLGSPSDRILGFFDQDDDQADDHDDDHDDEQDDEKDDEHDDEQDDAEDDAQGEGDVSEDRRGKMSRTTS